MKTDLRALELYATGVVRAGQSDGNAMAGIRPTVLSLTWFTSAVLNEGPVRALFCSLLLHGVLLVACLTCWHLWPMEQAPPSVISVFTLQQEGEPETPGVARSRNAPTVKYRKAPIAQEKGEVKREITPAPLSSTPPRSDAGLAMAPGPPMHVTAKQGDGLGTAVPNGNPVAGTGEGSATGEVLAHPLYQANPPPPYPRLARKLGQEGVVLLEVLVSVTGLVDDLWIAASSGHEPLDAAALDAVRFWRFSAGQRNGQPVAMRVRVPVRFSLRTGS